MKSIFTKTTSSKGIKQLLLVVLVAALICLSAAVSLAGSEAQIPDDPTQPELERVENSDVTPERLLEQGSQLVAEGKYDEAIELLTMAIELRPDDFMGYYTRGYACLDIRQLDRATADFTKAIELNPSIAGAYCGRGATYILQGQCEWAIADYSAAIALDSNYTDAYTLRANAYNVNGQYELAIADATTSIELDPDIAEPYSIRGCAYCNLGLYAIGIADFTKAIALGSQPSHIALEYENRARAYEAMGNMAAAESDWQAAANLTEESLSLQNESAVVRNDADDENDTY